jgi:hypothetical protein
MADLDANAEPFCPSDHATRILLAYFDNLRNTHVPVRPILSSPPVLNFDNTSWAHEIAEEFKSYFGTDANDLPAWQGLLWHCHVPPEQIPNDIDNCKQIFDGINVNIFDLVEATRLGMTAKNFKSMEDLKTYSMATGRIWPKEVVAEGDLLRQVMRRWKQPRKGKKGRVSGAVGVGEVPRKIEEPIWWEKIDWVESARKQKMVQRRRKTKSI